MSSCLLRLLVTTTVHRFHFTHSMLFCLLSLFRLSVSLFHLSVSLFHLSVSLFHLSVSLVPCYSVYSLFRLSVSLVPCYSVYSLSFTYPFHSFHAILSTLSLSLIRFTRSMLLSLFRLSVSGRCCLDGSSIHQPIFCCSSHSPDTCPHPVLHILLPISIWPFTLAFHLSF